RLLLVAGARGVDVLRLEDRQVAVREGRLGQPRKAGAERLATALADEDAQAGAVGGPREDLASVRAMEGELQRALAAERRRERQVVVPRGGQRLLLRAREQQRLQQPPDGVVGRPAALPDQLLAPDVPLGAERSQDAACVCRARVRLGAARRRLRRGGRE